MMEGVGPRLAAFEVWWWDPLGVTVADKLSVAYSPSGRRL